jgi:hypothetical protein
VGALDPSSDVQLAVDASSPVPPYWIDCVGVIHVVQWRGIELANATRFGESNPSLRTVARISDLGASDLRAFCDWEACVRVNGYGHTCWVNDAGFEQCRMCDGSADCDGHAMSEDDCVAHASDPGRATCHVGLLQECTLQQSLRGPADTRVTQTCAWSAQACAGSLPGDLTTQALAAQHETDQVAVEEATWEESVYAKLVGPDASQFDAWLAIVAQWDGGTPIDVGDASAEAQGAEETGGDDGGADDGADALVE